MNVANAVEERNLDIKDSCIIIHWRVLKSIIEKKNSENRAILNIKTKMLLQSKRKVVKRSNRLRYHHDGKNTNDHACDTFKTIGLRFPYNIVWFRLFVDGCYVHNLVIGCMHEDIFTYTRCEEIFNQFKHFTPHANLGFQQRILPMI